MGGFVRPGFFGFTRCILKSGFGCGSLPALPIYERYIEHIV